MPRAKISEFSTTAGDNTDIDGINIGEGCAPSGINDAIRELMAQLKDFQSGAAGDNITVVGTLAAKGTSASGADLKLYEDTDNGTNYVGFIAPASIASNVQWTLPSADGSSGQALQTNGSGTLSFATLGVSAGGTGQTTYTDGQLLIGNSTGNTLTKATLTAGSNITITNSAGGITIAAAGGSPGGSNTQVQFNNSGAFAGSANMTFNGTSLTLGGNPTLSAGTANGVAYLNGSKALTTGSALVFDGNNLGLGVTPSAWGSGSKVIQINRSPSGSPTTVALGDVSNEGIFSRNAYNDGTWKYVLSDVATRYQQSSGGQHQWYTAPSGTAGNAISFTQAMTLDASGNLGVGTTTPASFGKFAVRGAVNLATWGDTSGHFSDATTGSLYITHSSNKVALKTDADLELFCNNTGDSIIFSTNAAERARITSGGDFGIGTTSPVSRLEVDTNIQATSTVLSLTNRANWGWNTHLDFRKPLTDSAPTVGLAGRISSLFEISNNYALGFSTTNSGTNTERARITSGGYFKASNSGAYGDSTGAYHELYQTAAGTQCAIFRSSSGSYTSTVLTLQCDRNTTDATYNFFSASVPGVGTRLVIADSGNVTNVNGSYGTISDAKMKTDIVDAGSQWADIKAIRFRKFKMKNDPSGLLQLGVVAQELEQTSPGLVEEHPDTVEVTKTRTVEVRAVLDEEGNEVTPATTREEEYTENEPTGTTTKSVKTSVLLMKAAVALQEAMARIETLEAKIAALEAK